MFGVIPLILAKSGNYRAECKKGLQVWHLRLIFGFDIFFSGNSKNCLVFMSVTHVWSFLSEFAFRILGIDPLFRLINLKTHTLWTLLALSPSIKKMARLPTFKGVLYWLCLLSFVSSPKTPHYFWHCVCFSSKKCLTERQHPLHTEMDVNNYTCPEGVTMMVNGTKFTNASFNEGDLNYFCGYRQTASGEEIWINFNFKWQEQYLTSEATERISTLRLSRDSKWRGDMDKFTDYLPTYTQTT